MTSRADKPGRTILLVDDSPRIRPLVLEILSDVNCPILEAGDAEQALEVAESNGPIDMLITDITMPGRNGMELARLLRQRYPGMLVLFMSGYTLPSAPAPGFQFIEKPFRPDALVRKVLEMFGDS
jgi:CheY-like chemotaxis protein